jgi:hypothetical protein
VADSVALHRAKQYTYQMATTTDDELSNLTLNTKSLSLVCPTSLPFGVTYHAHTLTQSCMQVECSKPLWGDVALCPSVGPSGRPILEDVNFAVQAVLPLLHQVLDVFSRSQFSLEISCVYRRGGCGSRSSRATLRAQERDHGVQRVRCPRRPHPIHWCDPLGAPVRCTGPLTPGAAALAIPSPRTSWAFSL